MPLHLVSRVQLFRLDGNLHVKGNPFRAWRHIWVFAAVVQLCERRDLAGRDAVPVGEEGVGPLLEEAVC